jgi:hypothetical protein
LSELPPPHPEPPFAPDVPVEFPYFHPLHHQYAVIDQNIEFTPFVGLAAFPNHHAQIVTLVVAVTLYEALYTNQPAHPPPPPEVPPPPPQATTKTSTFCVQFVTVKFHPLRNV